MKKMKKGFTIVELIIVIAVIAILAAVLFPTFTSVTDRAKESAALQEAKNAYTVAYADALADGYINAADDEDGNTDNGIQIMQGNYSFTMVDGALSSVDCTAGEYANYSFTVSNGAITGATKG